MIIEGNTLLLTEWAKVDQDLDDEEDMIYEWSTESDNREHKRVLRYRKLSVWEMGRKREEDSLEEIELWEQYFQRRPIGDNVWIRYLNVRMKW